MILALEFSDNVDPTALATVGLALITVGLLLAGWRSLLQNQRQIKIAQGQLEQTQEDLKLSRREVEEAHRPVVVPVVERAQFMDLGADGAGLEICPQLRRGRRLFIPVRNIGAGPALNLEASIQQLSGEDASERSTPGQTSARVAGLGVTALIPLLITLYGWSIEAVPSFALSIEYNDVAEKGWATKCVYVTETGSYEGLTFKPVEREGRPVAAERGKTSFLSRFRRRSRKRKADKARPTQSPQ
jgi:hypothetical protein